MVNKRYVFIGLVILLGCIPLYDLLSPGIFVGHDTRDHVVRIAQFYQSLREGIIIPRWSSNLNWGYGHPVIMFLYPLPSYTAAIFRLFGLSFEQVAELVFATGYVLSGLTMYWWVREWGIWQEKSEEYAGLAAAMLYMYAPYRFVDVYVRGAIGENFFFMWPPLVALFTRRLINKISLPSCVGLSVSLAGMLLSHNALSIMFLPVLVGYGIYIFIVYYPDMSNRAYKTYISIFLSYVLGFGMAAFFLVPAFIEGKYTLRNIVTQGVTLERFETVSRIIYSPWSFGGTGQLSVQLGIVQWTVVLIGLGIGAVMIFKNVKPSKGWSISLLESRGLLAGSYIVLVIALYFMTKGSVWIYTSFNIFQTFQFPWRWLSLALFAPAVLGGVIVYILPKRFGFIFVLAVIVLSLATTATYWHASGHTTMDDSYYTGIYEGTTDTGESSPIWSVRFMEKKPDSEASIIEGSGTITPIFRTSISRQYRISVQENARVLENTLYFPGWNVYIDGVKQRLRDVWWQDPTYRGLITYFVPSGVHTVEIVFEKTAVRAFSDIVSAVSGTVILMLFVFSVYKTWNKKHTIS